MNNKIKTVNPGSIGEEMGIESGDILISINNNQVNDVIDYRFLMADESVLVEIEKSNGEVWELDIEKEYSEDLGVEFENSIMDEAKRCSNNCIFCFIDQLPKGMRKTMYFKDDDSRLSFLQGNFVTLTNLKDEDIDRIIRYRISPINISVHTTNPELRKKMLNNKFAGNIYERLKKLSDAGIKMNCQIVLCPDVNNMNALTNTVEDLYKLYPNVMNIAAVPVGITRYREGLFKLHEYNSNTAKMEIQNLNKLQQRYIKEVGEPFVRLADEFYVMSGMDVPESSFYGSYDQIEDGIGMIRFFRDSIENTICNLSKVKKGSYTFVTGTSAYSEIKNAGDKIMIHNKNISINTIKAENNFFGKTITVAGLLTGQDIIAALKENNVNEYIIIPKNMLKYGENIFLDDLSVQDIEKQLNAKVLIVEYTGEDLIEKINNTLH